MTRSVRRQRYDRATALRSKGKTWVEIGRAIHLEWPELSPRAAMRLAHTTDGRCWTQQDAADAWHRVFPKERPPEAKDISRWEAWPRPSGKQPSMGTLDRMARVYGCGLADLVEDVSDYRDLDPNHGDDDPDQADTSTPMPSPPLSATPEATPSAAGNEPWQLLDTITRANISAAAVEEMEVAIWRSAERFPTSPTGTLAGEVSLLLTRTHEALGHPQSVAVRTRLVRLLGYLAGLSASTRFDQSDTDRSVTSWFRVGRHAASEAEDHDLDAWLLAHQALVSHLTNQPPQDTYLLLAEAAEHAAQACGPRRHAWVLALKARSAGVLGEANEAAQLLDEAHNTLQQADPPGGPDFFDGPRLEGMRGTTMLNLGHLAAADDALYAALAARHERHGRGRAWLTLDLAVCRARQGEVDEAARLSEVGLALAGGPIRSITARARTAMDELERAGGSHHVPELTERIIEIERTGQA